MYAIAARHAFGRQAFAVAVSSVWSSLHCKLSPSIRQFQEFTTDAFLQLGHSAMCRIKEIDIYFIQFTTILTDENSMHAHLTTINTTHTHTHTHNTSDLNASAFLCIHIRRRFICRKLSFPAVLWRRLQQQMPDGICRTTSRITREREREITGCSWRWGDGWLAPAVRSSVLCGSPSVVRPLAPQKRIRLPPRKQRLGINYTVPGAESGRPAARRHWCVARGAKFV